MRKRLDVQPERERRLSMAGYLSVLAGRGKRPCSIGSDSRMCDKALSMEIEKSYPKFRIEASIDVNQGEFFSLVGPSGCGKTTLLRLIVGLEEPDRGRIFLNGRDITDLPSAKRRIGLVFQEYALFPHLTVAGNIEYGLRVAKIPEDERKERLREMLALFALEETADRGVGQLSGGERQRVALARALAPQPLLLLLDEPFSALDYSLRQRLRRELKALQKRLGFTVIFVTHQQAVYSAFRQFRHEEHNNTD